MRKLGLLMMPLMAVSLLASCGNKDPEPEPQPTDEHVVNEQEFNNACSFKDITYLQLNYYDGGEKLVVKEMSPKVYHYVSSSEEINSYSETYVGKNNDGTYDEYYRYSKTRLFSLRKNVGEDAFITPQSDDVNILSQIDKLGLSYNSFTYNKEIESYAASTTSGTINLTLKFNNKKVVSYAIKTNENENYSTEFIYSYEEKTPKLPDKTARWYDYEDWWNYCSNGVEYEQATEEDIKQGIEVKLTVNGVEHKVRLIDVDKDVDANGNTIHCTFNFLTYLVIVMVIH
ncbi:MAG: hypothetical protein MJ214_01900 [Bacilli bacterium]|nr:hypothetical protein [Bacilli bacterium]